MAQQQTDWILIRGLTRESGHWGRFPKILEAAYPSANIIRVDLPGAGKHHKVKCPLNMPEIARFVRQDYLSQRKNPDSAPYLISISLGAMIALEWMRLYPGEVQGAVLMNSSLRGLSPIFHRLRPFALVRMVHIASQKDIAKRERLALELTSNRPDVIESTHPEWVKIQQARPVSTQNALRQLTAAGRFHVHPETPLPELLVLNSTHDRLAHPACSEAIHKTWPSQLRTHPTAGHDLALDDPEWVANNILKWK